MNFNLSLPLCVISGEGAVLKSADRLCAFGKKALIITGKSSAEKSGALSDVLEALCAAGVEHEIFSGIGPNPLISACFEAGEVFRRSRAEFIIGVGGGSVLDAAKAAAIYAANEGLSARDIYNCPHDVCAVKTVLIGTTAGTGSEVGRVSVLTDDETGRKRSIGYSCCYPALTLADHRYTRSAGFEVTVSTALDALAHALEGYFSKKCTLVPECFAEKAVQLIFPQLRGLFESESLPSDEGRSALYYGSLCAGITLGYCGTAFPHPLGYTLTEGYSVPHGFACAVFMPKLIERAKEFCPKRLSLVLSAMGASEGELLEVVGGLTRVEKITMTESEIGALLRRWEQSTPSNFTNSPGGLEAGEAAQIMRELFLK